MYILNFNFLLDYCNAANKGKTMNHKISHVFIGFRVTVSHQCKKLYNLVKYANITYIAKKKTIKLGTK